MKTLIINKNNQTFKELSFPVGDVKKVDKLNKEEINYLIEVLTNSLSKKDPKTYLEDQNENLSKPLKNSLETICSYKEDEYKAPVERLSFGALIGGIIALLKSLKDSQVSFSDLWNKSIDTTYQFGLSYANFLASSKYTSATGQIIGGAVSLGCGVVAIGGGVVDAGLAISQKGEMSALKMVDSEELSGATSLKKMSIELEAVKKTTDGAKTMVKGIGSETSESVIDNIEREVKITKIRDEGGTPCENEQERAFEAKKIKLKYEAKRKIPQALYHNASALGQGFNGASSGIAGAFAAGQEKTANVTQADQGLANSKKEQNKDLYSSTQQLFNSTAALSQGINAFIRAAVPA